MAWLKGIRDAYDRIFGGGLPLYRDFEVSFETAEQTTHTVYFPQRVRIVKLYAFVTKALGITDAGTITLKNNAGTAMAGGVITLAISAPLATEGSATPTSNYTIGVGEKLQITVTKATAGGKARIYIEAVTL